MKKIMKNNYFLRTVFTLLLCGFFSMSYAADWYISSAGNDTTGDGSMGNPWATFSKAHTDASSGDVINVSGMILFSTDVTLTKNITVQGTSNLSDGFDGQGGTRFIQTAGFNLTMSNLKLTNGLSAGNGGALLLSGGVVNITNVNFDSNKAKFGGAIYAAAGTITIDGCSIQNSDNTAILLSKGGAIYVTPTAALTLNVNNTLIKNNKTITEGGALYYVDTAAPFASNITFANCALVSNTCGGTTLGGAVYISNTLLTAPLNLSFINSTICKNTAGGTAAGAILIGNAFANSSINLINCTVTENTCLVNGTGSAGIRVLTAVTTNNGVVKIYNSILENNYYPNTLTNTSNYTTDFAWQGEGFLVGTKLIIENSIIGRPMSATNAKWLVATNSFPTSKYNYVSASSGNVTDSYIAKFGTFNTTTNSYPLLNTSLAIDYGLKSFLTSLVPSISTDQIGASRSLTNGKCSAGAIEFSAPASEKIWKGISSTDITIPSNWYADQTASNTDYIVIPKGKTNYPLFSSDFTISGSLIEVGAKLFVAEGKVLTNSGTITNSGSLILKSSATGTASLVSSSSVANVQQQRYLSSNQRGWRMLSNPLSSTTFTALATDSNITLGTSFTGEYLTDTNTWTSTDGTVAMDTQKAYKVFVTGLTGEAPDYVTGPSNVTVLVKGTAASAVPTAINTVANQYYLIANPYTAPVSVAAIIAASTGLSNSVSYYDPTKTATDVKVKAGGYNAFTISGAAGSATDIVLPPMGTIFAQASSAGSIAIPQSAIFTGTPLQVGTYNHKTAQAKAASKTLKVIVSSEGINYDTVALQFKTVGDASSNIDFGKLPNAFLDVYILEGTQKRAISELELVAQNIPLGITSTLQKSFSLKVAENSIPSGYEAVLIDNVLNTTTVMTQGTNYDFVIDANPASQGDARFAINLKTSGTLSVVDATLDSKIQLWPNPAQGYVNIINGQNEKEGTSKIEISTVNGQLIHSQKLNPGTTTTIQTNGWAAGVYFLKASNKGAQTTKKLIIQ